MCAVYFCPHCLVISFFGLSSPYNPLMSCGYGHEKISICLKHTLRFKLKLLSPWDLFKINKASLILHPLIFLIVATLWIIISLSKLTLIFPFCVCVRECVCHPPLEIDSVTDPLVLWNLKTAIFWREVKKSTTRWLLRARAPVYLLNNSHVLIQRVGGGSAVSGGMMGEWGELVSSVQFCFYYRHHVLL